MAYLVLTRKEGQEIKIGDDITVKIVAVNGNQIRIGINAPYNLRITRPEKHDEPNHGDATGS